MTPKLGADGLSAPENPVNQNLAGATETRTESVETLLHPQPQPPDGNGNTTFEAMTNLNAQPTILRAAFPKRTTLLCFSGRGDRRPMVPS
jgi:hypothetical protein